MTALALDVRELSLEEIGLVSGGGELSSDQKLAITVATTIATAMIPLPVLVFAIVVFTPSPAY